MGWGGLQLAAFGVVGFLALPDDGLGGRGFLGALALAAASAIGFRGCDGGVAAGSLFFYLHKYGASAYQVSADSYCFRASAVVLRLRVAASARAHWMA